MAINKQRPQAAEDFIAKAEGGKHVARLDEGNRAQITLSIAPPLLQKVDAIDHRENLTRAALLTVWINDQLRRDVAREAV